MGHEIREHDSFIACNKRAWHNLGDFFNERLTLDQCVLKSKPLQRKITKEPNYGRFIVQNEDGSEGVVYRPIPGSFHTRRDDGDKITVDNPDYDPTVSVVGEYVGGDYVVIQDLNMLRIPINSIIDVEKDAVIDRIGTLKNGRIFFVTIKLPDEIRAGNGTDITNMYLVIFNSHDGKLAASFGLTGIRVECNNTLQMVLNRDYNSNFLKFRHTSNSEQGLRQAAEILQLTRKSIEQEQMEVEQLQNTSHPLPQQIEFLNRCLNINNDLPASKRGGTCKVKKLDAVMDSLAITAKGGPHVAETGYGTYQSLSQYLEWTGVKYRKPDNALYSIVLGNGAAMLGRAKEDLLVLGRV